MISAPPTRFFELSGGRRVAYAIDGEGPPLVAVAWWVSHLEEDWAHAGFSRFFGALAEQHTVIRYDRPGTGLSDRQRAGVDLASEVELLAGLIDHLGLDRVDLLGIACAGPPAICYAARHPERVARLVFFGSYVRGSDVGPASMRDAMRGLVQAHWGIGSRALADLFAPELDADDRRALGRAQRRAATAEMAGRLLALTFDVDASVETRAVRAPALVLHRKGDRTIPFSAGRELAASLPDANLQTLEGDAHVPWYGDVDTACRAILGFLSGDESRARRRRGSERILRLEGSLWRARFDGEEVHLPNARGLADLAVLLAHPGDDVHAGRLWSGAETWAALGLGSDPVLDDEALGAYRERLRALEQELAEAEASVRSRRVEALRQERDQLAGELRSAVGLGGRSRELNSVSERARKAVSARIRASIKKVAEVHPALGSHLEKHIITGTYCCYRGDDGPAWEVDGAGR